MSFDDTFPCDADVEEPDATFASALVRNRGGPKRKRKQETMITEKMPDFDFAALREQMMAGRPKPEDLPF